MVCVGSTHAKTAGCINSITDVNICNSLMIVMHRLRTSFVFVGIPNLWMVETVDSEKVARALNRSWNRLGLPAKLNVMIQVNTSAEPNKNGCSPDDVVTLVKTVIDSCPSLDVKGLMTIGSFNHDLTAGPNPDFLVRDAMFIKHVNPACERLERGIHCSCN